MGVSLPLKTFDKWVKDYSGGWRESGHEWSEGSSSVRSMHKN
jgi:hypothetical protein